ncbi:hypothetical protein [Rhodococcoides kyotonense]|uniref:SCO6045-like C-terminal domain-containing protein n=1 Tax=Rhodococcoides kyotonense TaxID=398843 RepID=A0A239D3G4_9NOCA|nr:hypothetical protein [Rhodococcus kyotonensis]SNS26890.1 hypothetical protein SAMN05421642_101361 [Rhodococcus kyotonensis]
MTSLARRQEELVRALVAGGPVPAGFDEHAVEVATSALLRKRTAAVARRLPVESTLLGDRFGALFAEWASSHPRDGESDDARRFVEHLYDTAELTRPRRWRLSLRKGSWP